MIERNPGLTQTQVAEALGIKRTNFVGMLTSGEARPRGAAAGARQALLRALPRRRRRRADGKLKPVIKAHESRMIARVGEEGRDRLVALLQEIVDGARARKLKGGKASRAPRLGSAET